ncbi:serine-rich adhesin for platelets isoform X2 [Parasteatoda tepidariorum]|nr:centromere-associated protein E isoform X2 [Parasteatoda tepidariorum]XP_042911772.1 centromere-associated protein E isoform X2 [Parasteatoda tepidariorum]
MNSSLEVGIKDKLPSSSEKHVLFETFGEKTSRIKELSGASSLESSYYDQLQSIRDERDKEIQNLRHKLVQELERLHLQEQTLHQEIDQERREIKKERDLLFSEREKLKVDKDLFLKEQENKLEKKIREVEDIHIAKLHSKDKEIAGLHNELKERVKRLEHMEFELSTHREELDTLKRELDDANRMYKSVHEKYNSLLDENTNLVRKFERMSDYNILKEELVAKGRDISNLQHEIENLHRTAERDKKAYIETVTSLELKLKATEPKLQHLQKELNQKKNLLDMEEAMWQKEKEKLEQDSLTSQRQYKTVLQRIEEQKQDIHDLHQTIHILHYQLTSGNINQSTKLEIHDPLRTIPKTPFLPSRNKQILISNKNNPSTISQHYREKALDFTSDYKSRLNKLQQEMNEDFEKYSVIYHTSFDAKLPNIKPSLSQNSPAFTHNMKFHHPSSAKNSSYMPLSSPFDASKSLMEFGNLNLKYGGVTVPSFMNKNNSGRLSGTLTSSQNIYDSTKTFIADSNVTSTAHKKIYDGVFTSQSEQTLKASEVLNPSSSINKMYDMHEEFENFQNASFLPSRKDQNIFDTIKPIEHSSSEIARTASTGSTENMPKDIPVTGNVVENRVSFPDQTDIPFERSVLLPVTSNKFSFQNLQDTSTSIISSNRIPRDTISSKTDQNKFGVNRTNESTLTEIVKTVSTGLTENLSKDISTTETAIVENTTNFPITTDIPLQRSFLLPTATNKLSFQNTDNIDTKQSVVSDNGDTSIALTSSGPTASTKTAPIVVDLDAAWKRKTSLPSVNPPLLNNSNPLMFAKNISPVELISKGETKHSSTISNYPDSKSTTAKTDTETSGNMSSSTAVQDTIKNSEQYKQLNKAQLSQAEAIKELEKETESQNNNQSIALSDVSGTDEEIKEKKSFYKTQMQNTMKQTPEDSLSELSEVHLSCGSEQEEQKEESDNW